MLSVAKMLRSGDDKSSAGANAERGRLVLPRLLRKPARNLSHLVAGDFRLSIRGWFMLVAALLVLSGGVFYHQVDPRHSFVAQASSGLGFEVQHIEVSGGHEVTDIDVISRLDLGETKSLFTFDVRKARANLAELAWIKDVQINKSYPNGLNIQLVERKPFAIWQNANALALIERDGKIIDSYDDRYSSLPLLVGAGASERGAEIVHLVGGLSKLSTKVEAFVRVADRRWDLRLQNGITVRLPEKNVPNALARLLQLDEQTQLLAREVNSVDLRLENRLVVGLSEDGLAALEAKEEARKTAKKGQKT